MKPQVTLFAALAFATPAHAQSELEKGFAGALRGCEEWILNPASWSQGTSPFLATVGLGNSMGLVDHVDEAVLPRKELRLANHYWRINSTPEAGYVLIVSDRLPMCHITGGGQTDLQPAVEAILASPEFKSHWDAVSDLSADDIASTEFRNHEEPALSMVISRAKLPGQRLDRIQVIATAVFRTGK